MVEQDGYWMLERTPGELVPDGMFPDANVVTVEMVDFAFALDQNEIPAGQVILRFVNSSYTHAAHVAGIVTLADDTITSEDIIQMDALPPDDQLTGFYGGLYLESGGSADVIFEDLQPGTYTMACDFETEAGVPHFMLGMVAQFDVKRWRTEDR
jgi:plastocyanin